MQSHSAFSPLEAGLSQILYNALKPAGVQLYPLFPACNQVFWLQKDASCSSVCVTLWPYHASLNIFWEWKGLCAKPFFLSFFSFWMGHIPTGLKSAERPTCSSQNHNTVVYLHYNLISHLTGSLQGTQIYFFQRIDQLIAKRASQIDRQAARPPKHIDAQSIKRRIFCLQSVPTQINACSPCPEWMGFVFSIWLQTHVYISTGDLLLLSCSKMQIKEFIRI